VLCIYKKKPELHGDSEVGGGITANGFLCCKMSKYCLAGIFTVDKNMFNSELQIFSNVISK
jgi:hypothetical protein